MALVAIGGHAVGGTVAAVVVRVAGEGEAEGNASI